MVISRMFIFSMTARMVGTGQGEPAMIPVRRLEKSNLLKSGWSRTAMNIVGTPLSPVQRSFSTAYITWSGSYDSRMTMVEAWVTQARVDRTQPKQWNSGTGMQ